MRKPCDFCARKHLAQAMVLLNESRLGHPSHVWLAMGHMAEAEAEILAMYPDIAMNIREMRKQVEHGEDPDLMELIETITSRRRERTGRIESHPERLNAGKGGAASSCVQAERKGSAGNGRRRG